MFEYDLFSLSLRNNPIEGRPWDDLLLGCIQMINVDIMWSRASSIVMAYTDRILLTLRVSEQSGLLGPYKHVDDLSYTDHCGYKVAIKMVICPI